jgi:hypothetical protein
MSCSLTERFAHREKANAIARKKFSTHAAIAASS